MSDDVEAALVSERLRLLHAAEEAERVLQQELLTIGRESRDLTRELVQQGRRREDRELETLTMERERRVASAEAETRRVDAEIEDRRVARNWLRSAVGDKILVPLGLAVATAVGMGVSALAAWAVGGGQ